MATMRDEQSIEKLVDRGRAFAAVGDSTRAEEYLAAALQRGARPERVMPVLLSVCVRDGRYRSAIFYAENHLRAHPSDVATRFVLGTLYAAIGEAPRAKEHLTRVVEATPNEARAHYALAVLMRDQQDPIGADRHFREYLRLAPEGAHAEEARASLLTRIP